MAAISLQQQTFELEVESELRVLVGENSTDVIIELSSGGAEMYGAEMELNKEYSVLPNSSIAVFTWEGCVIKVIGTTEAAYVVNKTDIILHTILHTALEERRIQVRNTNENGPVILVVGENDMSKSSLCRLLLNYAVRMRWPRRPLFIDLNVREDSISPSFPGTIGVFASEKPTDIVYGFGCQPVQVYQYGYLSTYRSIVSYILLLRRLNQTLQSDLMQKDKIVKHSGVIINGCNWYEQEIERHGYSTLSLVINTLEIDVLCVLHSETLYSQLERDKPSSVQLIYIPEINGVERRLKDKSQSKQSRIHKYFYGPTNELQPFTFEVKYSDIHVFRVVTKRVESYIEILAEVDQNDVKLKRVKLTPKLIDQVLALSSADNVEEDIMYMNVIGHICITDVDIERDTITVLSKQPAPLPKKILLIGNITFKKCL